MEEKSKICAALVAAQKQFSPALKTSTNPHFRSKYASLDACVEAVIDALNNNGIFLMQKTDYSENGVTVETVFIHESGEMISAGTLFVPSTKQDAQSYGSALTYARRYSLMASCGIAPEDDDGNAASHKRTPATHEQIDAAILKIPADKQSAFFSYCDIKDPSNMTESEYRAAEVALIKKGVL